MFLHVFAWMWIHFIFLCESDHNFCLLIIFQCPLNEKCFKTTGKWIVRCHMQRCRHFFRCTMRSPMPSSKFLPVIFYLIFAKQMDDFVTVGSKIVHLFENNRQKIVRRTWWRSVTTAGELQLGLRRDARAFCARFSAGVDHVSRKCRWYFTPRASGSLNFL